MSKGQSPYFDKTNLPKVEKYTLNGGKNEIQKGTNDLIGLQQSLALCSRLSDRVPKNGLLGSALIIAAELINEPILQKFI